MEAITNGRSSFTCKAVDTALSYTPFISTLYNLTVLFSQYVNRALHKKTNKPINGSTVKNALPWRRFTALLPFFGNLVLIIYDLVSFMKSSFDSSNSSKNSLPVPSKKILRSSRTLPKALIPSPKKLTFDISWVTKYPEIFPFLDEKIKQREDVQEIAKNHKQQFSARSGRPEQEETISLINEKVALCPEIFPFLQEKLRANKRIVKTAVIGRWETFQHAPQNVKNDKQFVLELLKNERIVEKHPEVANIFSFLNPELQGDTEVISKAANLFPAIFHLVSEPIKKNRRILTEILEQAPGIFEFLSPSFQKDKELAAIATDANWHMFAFASEELQKDQSFIIERLKIYPKVFEILPRSMRENKTVVKRALKWGEDYCPWFFKYAGETLKQDKDFAEELLQSVWGIFEYLDEKFRSDEKMARKALNKNTYDLKDVGENLKKNPDFIMSIRPTAGVILMFADKSLRTNKKVVKFASLHNEQEFERADDSLKKDKLFALELVIEKPGIFKYLDESLQSDEKTARAALSKNPDLFTFLKGPLKNNKQFLQDLCSSLENQNNPLAGRLKKILAEIDVLE